MEKWTIYLSAALSATYCNDIDKFSRRFIKLNLLQDIDEPPRQYNETQICVIEGSRNAIDRCLEYLREMFPLESHPQFTLQQVTFVPLLKLDSTVWRI